MKTVNVAVLGAAGWMGRVHTMAFQTFAHFFGVDQGQARVVALGVSNAKSAQEVAFRAPGARVETDWRKIVNDPEIDLIDICLPDNMHYEVAKAALLAGKHVFCEKPLADTAAQARELADLAQEKGVITRVGHAFPRNPAHDRAKELIESGALGEITMVKACQHIDVFADPMAPFMWRADGDLAPTGIIGDTGSHVFSFLEFLVGQVSELIAENFIVAEQRPKVDGPSIGAVAGAGEVSDWAQVTNPDGTHMMCRFENGARGLIDFSRTAMGRKFQQSYEIYGTKGSLLYDYDQVNRLRYYSDADAPGVRGFREIDVGPENSTYAAFLPLPNFALGYNEMKIIEAAEVIQSICRGQEMWPSFESGHHIAQMVEACMESSAKRAWVTLGS